MHFTSTRNLFLPLYYIPYIPIILKLKFYFKRKREKESIYCITYNIFSREIALRYFTTLVQSLVISTRARNHLSILFIDIISGRVTTPMCLSINEVPRFQKLSSYQSRWRHDATKGTLEKWRWNPPPVRYISNNNRARSKFSGDSVFTGHGPSK